MATTLQELIGYENLCGIIQDPRGSVPDDIVPPAFMAMTRRVSGNTCKYVKVEGTRQTARLAHYGSTPRRRQLKGVSDLPIVLLFAEDEIQHTTEVLEQLQAYDSPEKQSLGKQEIARHTQYARSLQNNLRISTVYSTLSLGAVYGDADGNLLPSSSGALISADWGVPAGNRNQIGGIIATKWSTAAADIIGQISSLRKYARQLTGYPIKWAWYGADVMDSLANNTAIAKFIQGNPAYATSFAQGEIPDGFLKLNWRPFNEAFFEDASGTLQDWCPGDRVVFTPDPSPDWWEGIEGSYPVPTTLNISSDAEEAAGNFTSVNGMYSYALVTTRPSGIVQVFGDTFIYALKVPKAIFIADVEF